MIIWEVNVLIKNMASGEKCENYDVGSKLDAMARFNRNYRKEMSSGKSNQLIGQMEKKQKVQTLQNFQDWKTQPF